MQHVIRTPKDTYGFRTPGSRFVAGDLRDTPKTPASWGTEAAQYRLAFADVS